MLVLLHKMTGCVRCGTGLVDWEVFARWNKMGFDFLVLSEERHFYFSSKQLETGVRRITVPAWIPSRIM